MVDYRPNPAWHFSIQSIATSFNISAKRYWNEQWDTSLSFSTESETWLREDRANDDQYLNYDGYRIAAEVTFKPVSFQAGPRTISPFKIIAFTTYDFDQRFRDTEIDSGFDDDTLSRVGFDPSLMIGLRVKADF